MKHLKRLQLNELNRYDKWLEKNKDVKMSFDIQPPKSYQNGKSDYKDLFYNLNDGKDSYGLKDKYLKNNPVLKTMLKKLPEDDRTKEDMEGYGDWNKTMIFNILTDSYGVGEYFKSIYVDGGKYSDYYDNGSKREQMINSVEWDNFDSVIKLIEEITFRGKDDDIDKEQYSILRENWKEIISKSKSYIKEAEYLSNQNELKAKKIAKKKNVEWESFQNIIAWVDYYRDGSYRKIPKEIFNPLQYLTVDPNNLPKTIYRGLFYDGAKIKDQEKFKQKWYKGSMPKEALRKATSWTTNIEVAKSFMTSQDNVKDEENGYHVMLKYDVQNAEDLIADFRNWEWMTFWNQQEILLSPSVKGYEVMEIFPKGEWVYKHNSDDYDNADKTDYQKFADSGTKKEFASYSGHDIKSIMQYGVMDIMLTNLPEDKKYQIAELRDKTISELPFEIYGMYNDDKRLDMLIVLYQFISSSSFRWSDDFFISKDTARVNYEYTAKFLVDDIKKLTGQEIDSYSCKITVEDIIIKSVSRKPLQYVFDIDFSKVKLKFSNYSLDKDENDKVTKHIQKYKKKIINDIKNESSKRMKERRKTTKVNFK
jgi:hypothetical protein